MGFFNRKKKVTDKKREVAISVAQTKNKAAAKKAKVASAKLNKMIENNGFTVTIALAMGAKQKGVTHHGH